MFELSKAAQGKKLIGYGTGITMLGTLDTTPLQLSYLIDDNPAVQGQEVAGIPIFGSDKLKAEKKGDFFLVLFASTPHSLRKIMTRLTAQGYRLFEDFVDCSYLHFYSISRRLSEELGISCSYERFQQVRRLVLNSSLPNLSTISGSWLYVELLNHMLPRLAGDIAECGVYYGGNAMASLLSLPTLEQRTYHLFDSFDGFQGVSKYDPLSRKDDFQGTDLSLVRSMFASFPQVQLHKGYFNETLPQEPDRAYSMVYIDCDLYEPTVYCVNYFEEKMDKGGGFFLHDYWVPQVKRPKGSKANFEGIRQAVNELFEPESIHLIVFPETTHALIIAR